MVLIRGILDFINNKVLLLFFSIVICILLMGCAKSQRMNSYGKEQDCDTNLREEVSEDANFSQQHYTIYNGNNDDDRWNFYYDLFDLEGNVVKHECTYMDEPQIQAIDTDILRVTVQAGTGRGATYSYYYDIKNNTVSPVYYYLLGEKSNLVAFFEDGQINICEMFQKQACYKQIAIPKELEELEEPVISVMFSEDLKQATIVYITGEKDTLHL